MTASIESEPESIADLRQYVRDWLEKAESAVKSFHNPDNHTFWRDSSKYRESKRAGKNWNAKYFSATTTARCYMALAYADRCLRKSGSTKLPDWGEWFNEFVSAKEPPLKEEKGKIVTCGEPDKSLNNFDIAHVADFWFVADYLRRFIPNENGKAPSVNADSMAELLLDNFTAKAAEGPNPVRIDGQIAFEEVDGEWGGHHFFVTLHSLRAFSIFGWELEYRDRIYDQSDHRAEPERQFCIEQCFFVERSIQHRQDIVGLAFALTIHCLYARQVSDDLCLAVVNSLAAAQQENGSWPTAYPIFRGAKRPWHITSHEIALCLTWLYFCPHMPDKARPVMLQMMERYFRKWVIPTYTELPKSPGADEQFCGWLDDHTMSSDFVVGWASGIVCHFLANYDFVLSNYLNRRVIESLGLQPNSSHYLVDITAYARSKRWTKTLEGTPRKPSETKAGSGQLNEGGSAPASTSKSKRVTRATWFDLAPFAWESKPSVGNVAEKIRWKWSDPSEKAPQSSDKLAELVLLPLLESPGERPAKNLCAGILPGEPGTRKTSLVHTIGDIVQWPVVTVPASVIFEHGFDSMEARASEVFRRLCFLTGCVVFFDEFEEFFRDRGERPKDVESPENEEKETNGKDKEAEPPENEDNGENGKDVFQSPPKTKGDKNGERTPIHNRTIAAFTTPAMLPRLQELHDVGRCLIFFATNHPKKVDWAIKRPGRFDFRLEINHPTHARLVSYLQSPTRRVLADLGFKVDDATFSVKASDKAAYTVVSEAVVAAMKKLQSNVKIKFADVESALRKVVTREAELNSQKERDGKPIDDNKLKEELNKCAEQSLSESIKREEESRFEPPDLLSLST